MSFFSRLFSKGEAETATPPPPADPRTCHHPVVAPAWASAADMWQKRPPIGFTCRDCLARLTPDEQRARQEARLSRRTGT
jgi:hypothetical protein